jgi:tartrate-resistant acid phosphatase type 5
MSSAQVRSRSRAVCLALLIMGMLLWAWGMDALAAPAQQSSVRFAVIGDYGTQGQPEADVAALVRSWNPELVITTGDNNYSDGAASTIDTNIGQYYHSFIAPYRGAYGSGADRNRFFPALGNHDWVTAGAQPYLDYFTLPGNERYYELTWGPVEFFAVDSDAHEPDGITADSVQGRWLKGALEKSQAAWKVVYMHHPPYSSGLHGSTAVMQWPYSQWGASIVLAGHDHDYERLVQGGMTYVVNGLGGTQAYGFLSKLESSRVRFKDDYGAMLVEADRGVLTYKFVTRAGKTIDTYTKCREWEWKRATVGCMVGINGGRAR